MAIIPQERKSLLSSQARIQAPWIKVTIGKYTFGVFSKKVLAKDANGFYSAYDVQYPNYIKSLNIIKINGQVNQYTLTINYPVRQQDDPNFFEKVFSADSKTRKIIFSYGDSMMPDYVYKEEEAIITQVSTNFGFGNGGVAGSVLTYTIKAVSSAALGKQGTFSFIYSHKIKPSDEIKRIVLDTRYGLQNLFPGITRGNINDLIAGDDAMVEVAPKINIAPLDYIIYLAGCMIPTGSSKGQLTKDIYILTIHDESIYDRTFADEVVTSGPYFKITRTTYAASHSDAYEIDIGYNTAAIVQDFQITNNENYSIYYDYQGELYPEEYVKRINNKGEWEDIYAPSFTSKNDRFRTTTEDQVWYTKLTKYPISATIKIQGLLRPATLMQYVRLNVIFTGGHKHISSGLYIVTQQVDQIDESGYKTTLKLSKIDGDDFLNIK